MLLQLLLVPRSYKHLDEPFGEGRFVFECILAGILQTLPPVVYHVQDTLDCTLNFSGLTFFLEILCSLLQNKLFIAHNVD